MLPERLLAASKPVTVVDELSDPPVIILGIRGHDCNGRHLLDTMQLEVQVLPGLNIPYQAFEQRPATVGQHSHR